MCQDVRLFVHDYGGFSFFACHICDKKINFYETGPVRAMIANNDGDKSVEQYSALLYCAVCVSVDDDEDTIDSRVPITETQWWHTLMRLGNRKLAYKQLQQRS